ncbi:hypothetical protein T484DRAFT_1814832 [Baffinella frigidus]|nr:hypothetical protein T484DRAFT_1814832 [Cryptophyta sp. CCMP2293]
MEELLMVHQGIKHARTGFDDVDFVHASQRSREGDSDWAVARPDTARRPGSGGLC